MEEMTKGERVRMAFRHEEPDIVPWELELSEPTITQLVDWYKEPRLFQEEFRHHWLGNHCKYLEPKKGDLFHGLVEDVEPGYWRDGWGIIWDTRGMYGEGEWGRPVSCILPEPELSGYEFPDPPCADAYSHYSAFISNNSEYYIFGNEAHLFEVAWALRGMENFLADLALHPEFVEDLLDRITEHYLGIIDESVKYAIDAFAFGDDWGTQNMGLLMGPKYWRRYFKPRLARMFSRVKEAGLEVYLHSDGAITEIFPDLIEIGLDIYNPLQPEIMDIYSVKQEFGEHLSFHGGIGVQQLLPHGTSEEVRKTVEETKKRLGAGGGYLLSQAHPDGILGDTPTENVVALLDSLDI